MSKRRERTSKRRREWPSTLRVDFIVILPTVGWWERLRRRVGGKVGEMELWVTGKSGELKVKGNLWLHLTILHYKFMQRFVFFCEKYALETICLDWESNILGLVKSGLPQLKRVKCEMERCQRWSWRSMRMCNVKR